MHPSFTRKDPDGALQIARKTRPKNKKSEKKPALDAASTCQQIMDEMISLEDGALLEFLPHDQNTSAFMNVVSERTISAEQEAQLERQRKLQQQLAQALKRGSQPQQQYDGKMLAAHAAHAQQAR